MTALSNDLLEDFDRPRGGRWIKAPDFSTKGQKIEGILLNIEVRDRTDDKGNVVFVRGTTTPRKIYHVSFEIPVEKRDSDEDNGVRFWDANESGQSAIRDAYKAVGTKELIGGRFGAVVIEEAPDGYSQATYKVKFEAAPKTIDLPGEDFDEDPF